MNNYQANTQIKTLFIPNGINIPNGSNVSITGISGSVLYGSAKGGGEIVLTQAVELAVGTHTVTVSYLSHCGCKTEKECWEITVVPCVEQSKPCGCHKEHCDCKNNCNQGTPSEVAHYLKSFVDGSTQYVNIKRYDMGFNGTPNMSVWYNYLSNAIETLPTGALLNAGLYTESMQEKEIVSANIPVSTTQTPLSLPVILGATGSQTTGKVVKVILDIPVALTSTVAITLKSATGVSIASATLVTGSVGLKELSITSTNNVVNGERLELVSSNTQAGKIVNTIITYK